MFFVGLSGSFIPYVLLAGFMVISFLKFNLERANDALCVNETRSEAVAFVNGESYSDDDLLFEIDGCQRCSVGQSLAVFLSVLRRSDPYVKPAVQKNRFLYDFLPKIDYFGLSPPSHC
ncbi:hypothetical protein ACT3CD_07255 [Geofilum sp. OHC36d9]|uniref:hypothetical protein n=1 Tax=Geofilum sp. OHC36d9 TaxID=3458413 RepID=UPI004033B91B